MERIGTVVEEKGETAVVHMRRHLSCEKCGRCGGILGGADQRDLLVEVINPVGARTGQLVHVESDDRQLIFVAFMLYIVPLAVLVAGVLLWLNLAPAFGLPGNQDLAAIGIGFGLMVLVFMGIRAWDRRVSRTTRYKPVITGLAKKEDADSTIDSPETED